MQREFCRESGSNLKLSRTSLMNQQPRGSVDYEAFLNHRRAFYETFRKIRAEHPVNA